MAGVQIGALHVSLSADSAAFDKGMDTAGKKSKETAAGVEKDAEGMASGIKDAAIDIAASLAAAFAVANMVERIKEQIDYADALADVAARSNQSAEALSAMDYALHFQDATLEDYTQGLQKLSQNMVAASEGSKDQAAIFEALHIKLREQDGQLRNSGDVILEFADQLAGMSNGATKTQLAMDILGKSAGPALLPFLNQGKAGIEEFTKKAQEMGLVVSTDFSNAAGQLNDNLDNLAYAATGAWRVLASQLTPALIDLSNAMLNANENGARQASILGNLAAAGVRFLGGAVTGAAEIGNLAVDATGKLMALGQVGSVAFAATGKTALDARDQFGEIWKSSSVIDNFTDALGRQKTVLFGLSEAERQYAENSAWADWVMSDLDAQTQKLATLNFEERKKQLLEESALKQKNAADAQKILDKQISDVASLRTSLMTDIQAEEAQYKLKNNLLENADKKAFKSANERNQLLQGLEQAHNKKMLELQEAFDKAKQEKHNADLLKEFDPLLTDIGYQGAQENRDYQDQQNGNSVNDELMADLNTKNALKLDMHKDFIASFLTLDQERVNSSITLGDTELEAKKKQNQETVAFFHAGLASMAQGHGKAAKAAQAIQKAQALYEIGVNTYRAAMGAYAALAPIPFIGPALGVAAAAAAIAMGASMAQGVLSGGGGAGAITGSAPPALSNTGAPTSQAEQRQTEQQNQQVTYLRIGENDVLLGRTLLDLMGGALADNGGEIKNLRIIPA